MGEKDKEGQAGDTRYKVPMSCPPHLCSYGSDEQVAHPWVTPSPGPPPPPYLFLCGVIHINIKQGAQVG